MPSFPPPPPKKDCYHYSIQVTISEKSRDEVNAQTVTFLKIVSQNAPNCISAHIHFKKFPEGMPPDPSRKLVNFSRSGLLPQTINP